MTLQDQLDTILCGIGEKVAHGNTPISLDIAEFGPSDNVIHEPDGRHDRADIRRQARRNHS